MRRVITTLYIFLPALSFARRGYKPYDGPIPGLEEAGSYLLIGLLLLLIGWFIVGKTNSSFISSLGMLIIFMGILCLLPALAYVQAGIVIISIVLGVGWVIWVLIKPRTGK